MKNPGTAAVLSFFVPGVGQIYNGEFLRGIFWLITRPIVWLVVMPLQYLFGGSQTAAPVAKQIPARANSSQGTSSTEKLQQLSKLRALHDSGAITQAEFDRLKCELLAI